MLDEHKNIEKDRKMTPDGWVEWYYHKRASFGAPALNYVDSTGRYYLQTCSKCRHRKRHPTKSGDWVCGHCGAPWRYRDQYIPKGAVQTSARPVDFGHVHAQYFDIGVLLSHFLRDHPWSAGLYVAFSLGWSQRKLAALGPWGKDTVRRRIDFARRDWGDRLHAAGITTSKQP